MAQSRLADFLRSNLEPILMAWDDFARTIEPPALTMSDEELRDHARQMLLVFADDLEEPQSELQRENKSLGLAPQVRGDTAAETHAETRLLSGYTVVQLVSEYRALRASVLNLWSRDTSMDHASTINDITRFNEAVDQAVAESVARYQLLVNKSQNMFLAILGHDLRNPLGALVMGSSAIMQALDIPPKYVQIATRMFRSADRMNRLVHDLIDFTRTHLGSSIPINTRPNDLAAVCEQVVNELRTAHPGRLIALEAPPSLMGNFDVDRIAQMLSNLLANALKYGSADQPVTVRLSSSTEGTSIEVNNQGPLIPADKLATIFEPLVRLASAQDPVSECTSLGIGLFVAREIAEAHSGEISVSSTPAQGTTFVVTLPR